MAKFSFLRCRGLIKKYWSIKAKVHTYQNNPVKIIKTASEILGSFQNKTFSISDQLKPIFNKYSFMIFFFSSFLFWLLSTRLNFWSKRRNIFRQHQDNNSNISLQYIDRNISFLLRYQNVLISILKKWILNINFKYNSL